MGENISKRMIIFAITLVFALVICGAASAASADIQVNQTINNSAPNFNDNVTFNTTVTNNGPDTATGVEVTNKLPSGVIYNNYTASQGTYDSITGIWKVGTLTNGQVATLFINTKINQTGIIKDIANKTAETETDSNLDNNSQETIINVPQAVDIKIDQYLWFNPGNTTYLSNIPSFVVDVRNGNDVTTSLNDATNVKVEYLIGDGYEFAACDTRGNGYTELITNSQGRVTGIIWTIPYMPKGSETTPAGIAFMNVFLRTIGSGTNTATLTNTASLLSVDQYDVNNSNNQKSVSVNVRESGDIQVDQTITGTIAYNNEVTITITAKNNGPNNSQGVTIQDLLPSGLQWISDNSNGAYNPTNGTWTIGTITNGTTKTLTIIAKIVGTGVIKNTAVLSAPLTPNYTDWNYNNNAKTVVLVPEGTTYTQKTNVIVKQYMWATPSSGIFYSNNIPVFCVDVRNIGQTDDYDDATNVVVSYTIADGYQYVGCDNRGTGTIELVTNSQGKVTGIIWTIPYMPKSSAYSPDFAAMNVFLRVIDTGNKTQNLTNTATIISPVYTKQPTVSLATSVSESADIQVNQTITGTPTYNNNVTITITAKNNGPNNSQGVTIQDLLPTGLQWISDNSNGAYNPTNGTWTIGTITNGTTKTLTIIAKIIGTGTIQNSAMLTAPLLPNFIDWNYNNNAQTVSITVPDAADIAVTQSSTKTSPNFGDTVTFTINAKNNGPDFATGIKITDIIPTGWKLISYNTAYGTFSNGVWTINNLLNDSTATLSFVVQILDEKIVSNIANLTAVNQYDYNSTNNITSLLITPDLGTEVTFTEYDDGHSTTGYALPFNVNLLGKTYKNSQYYLWIDVNGFVYFSKNGSYDYLWNYYQDYPIYLPHAPTGYDHGTIFNYIPMIAPFWDDIDLTTAYGAVYYKNEGDYVTITWNDVPSYHEVLSGTLTKFNSFQVRITRDGKIGFIYGDMQWDNDWYGQYSQRLGWTVYPYSFAGMNKGDASTYYQSWTGSQPLSNIANQMLWFNSANGNSASTPDLDPDIAVSQESSNYNPYTGDTITITITTTNNGPENATGVQVTDKIPKGLQLISATTSKGTYNPHTGVWDIGSMNVNESVTLTLVLKVQNVTGTIVNRAEKTAEDQYDAVTENDASEITLNVHKKKRP